MSQPNELEDRKQKEIEWADFRRTIDNPEMLKKYSVNSEFYQINRPVNTYVTNWLLENLAGKDVFEMACGTKGLVSRARHVIKSAIASDIAPESINLAKKNVEADPSFASIDYRVVDAENTGFEDNSFDVVIEGGALHHMDLDAAYKEAARILRPGGKFFCVEALRHNPIIHWYRKSTPHLRTAWEVDHILGRSEIHRGLKYFDRLDTRNFHIATLPAIPFRNTFLKEPLLTVGETLDTVLTRIPGFKWLSWQCVFVLENPKK
jgi:SAM-dependent methyltransferase